MEDAIRSAYASIEMRVRGVILKGEFARVALTTRSGNMVATCNKKLRCQIFANKVCTCNSKMCACSYLQGAACTSNQHIFVSASHSHSKYTWRARTGNTIT